MRKGMSLAPGCIAAEDCLLLVVGQAKLGLGVVLMLGKRS